MDGAMSLPDGKRVTSEPGVGATGLVVPAATPVAEDPFVETVLGPVPASELGHTQMHEHLLSDLWRGIPESAADSERPRYLESLSRRSYHWNRLHHGRDDLRLSSVTTAVSELTYYKRAGGRTVVDVTSRGLGRRPLGLREIAERSGVNIVMGCGYYCQAYMPASLRNRTVDDIAQEMVRDAVEGVAKTGVRAGIIGEIGMSWPVGELEQRVLTAAAIAQRETGLAISLHPGRSIEAPLAHLKSLASDGADISRVIVGHIDRTLFSDADIARVADFGCYVEFDLFGQENSYYSLNSAVDMPNDAVRIDRIRALVGRGSGSQVLISQDICHKTNLLAYGGEGYSHILTNVLPMMVRRGLSEADVQQITIDNPARALARRRSGAS